jgi:hypothetical protein
MAARPRGIHLLTAKEIEKAGDGDHNDGGGLVLRVRGTSATWVFRFTSPSGLRREMGLGTAYRNNAQASGKSVVEAREKAEKQRRLLRDDKDPIAERKQKRAEERAKHEARKQEAKAERTTLARVARAYHEEVIERSRSDKHAAQWIQSLETHVPADIWLKPVDAVSAPELHSYFIDITLRLPETGNRIVQRLCRVFADAEFRRQCVGNP